MPRDFYTKPGVLYNARGFLYNAMPGVLYNARRVLYNAWRFLYNARSSIQCPEFYTICLEISLQCPEFYAMPGVLYNARKIFKSTFCCHLGPLRTIGSRFFRHISIIIVDILDTHRLDFRKKSFHITVPLIDEASRLKCRLVLALQASTGVLGTASGIL